VKFPDLVQSKHPRWSGWKGYVLGTRKSFIAGRKEPAILVRFYETFKWDIAWLETDDLIELGGVMEVPDPSLLPKDLTLLKDTIMRKPGIWVANGHPGDPSKMLSWKPGSLTSFFDYLGPNGVYGYKAAHPEVPTIIRFQHPVDWHQDPTHFARTLGEQVASKWNDIKVLDPYVYFCNEVNLHYENGDSNPSNQHLYETPEFYQRYADWVRMTADVIKNIVPEMKLITPPFAFGHNEDGEPDENGTPKIGWSGYDFLKDTIHEYFDDILTFHAYWGDGGGSIKERLYGNDSSWYAFRWRRVLDLFEKHYGVPSKMIIDEAGNFGVKDNDFTEQILYYAQETLKDNRVLALTYFLWADPTNSPGNILNSWTQNMDEMKLNSHLTALANFKLESPPVEPPPVEPPIEPPVDPPPVEPEGLHLEITYEKRGLPLIIGDYPKIGVPIVVQPPYGNAYTVISGSKVEYGVGGFEAGYANMLGDYLLTVEGVSYKVYSKGDGSSIKLKFTESTEPEVKVVLESKEIPNSLAMEIMTKYPDIFTVK
jgi:hypothetical protein